YRPSAHREMNDERERRGHDGERPVDQEDASTLHRHRHGVPPPPNAWRTPLRSGPAPGSIRTAARSFALLARGFALASSSEATSGFFESGAHVSRSWNARLTSRSSSEWKLRMATRPPIRTTRGS